jgi:hypothetical protein
MTDYLEGLYEISKALCLRSPENQAHGLLGGEYGYGQNFKNEIFEMRPYHWGECICEYEELIEKWAGENRHSSDCYQTLFTDMHYINYGESGGWNFNEKPGHEEDQCDCIKTLYTKFNIPENSPGAYVLCTCGRDKKFNEYQDSIQHAEECLLDKPNFKHYSSGLTIYWYKYIGRGMEPNMELSFVEWSKIVEECLCTINGTPAQEESKMTAMREYLELSAEFAVEEDKFMSEHWANDLLDSPAALISVIETKIARAALGERRRIKKIAEDWIDEMRGHDGECDCKENASILENFINHDDFNEGEYKRAR